MYHIIKYNKCELYDQLEEFGTSSYYCDHCNCSLCNSKQIIEEFKNIDPEKY